MVTATISQLRSFAEHDFDGFFALTGKMFPAEAFTRVGNRIRVTKPDDPAFEVMETAQEFIEHSLYGFALRCGLVVDRAALPRN